MQLVCWLNAILSHLKGCRGALLLALDAVDAAILDEEAKSCAHLLSRDAELSCELLVSSRNILLGENVENILAEVNNFLVYAGLAGTSCVALKLSDLFLAKLNNLGVVVHKASDASVEVLLGGLDLCHDFLLSGTRVPVLFTSPFDSFFSEEVILFFLSIFIIPYF